jgi:hypothetical protein
MARCELQFCRAGAEGGFERAGADEEQVHVWRRGGEGVERVEQAFFLDEAAEVAGEERIFDF